MAMGVCIVIGLSSLVIGLLFSARTSKDPVSGSINVAAGTECCGICPELAVSNRSV